MSCSNRTTQVLLSIKRLSSIKMYSKSPRATPSDTVVCDSPDDGSLHASARSHEIFGFPSFESCIVAVRPHNYRNMYKNKIDPLDAV